MKNTRTQVDQGWTLQLSPRPEAFQSAAVVDGHNVWRNSAVVKSPVDLPEQIPATVPG